MAEPELLTLAEVCDHLRISTKKARMLIVSGELRAGKIGATWRVRRQDLDAFVEAVVRPAPAAPTRSRAGSRGRPPAPTSAASGELVWDEILRRAREEGAAERAERKKR